MIATKKSKRGNLYTKSFATADNFCSHFPMLLKSQAHNTLQDLCERYGVPAQVHTDNANEETKGAWVRVCREFLIKQTVTEPYSPWQNRCERAIQECKKPYRRLVDNHQIPVDLWDYTMEHASELYSVTVHSGSERCGVDYMTGDTPDISHLLHFDYYQPVFFLDPMTPFPESKEKIGRWLGTCLLYTSDAADE